jgi:predicted NAD/FAD-binding protein
MNANDEHTKSLWMSVAVAPDAPVLSMDVQCDSVVIGSGIAGLSCAYELAVEGQICGCARSRRYWGRHNVSHYCASYSHLR